MEPLKHLLETRSAGHLLDIGTGTGKFIPTLLNAFRNDYARITGIDTDIRAIEQANQQYSDDGNIHFLVMDVESLQFGEHTFDTVCISNTLHHLPTLTNALTEAVRVLKPDGLMLINEMFQDHQTEAQQNHVLYHHLEADIDSALGILHRHTYKKQEILDLIETLNVTIIDTIEYVEPKSDLKNEQEMTIVAHACDNHVARTIHLPNHEHFKRRGEEFKARLRAYGILRATQLVVICTKH
ncbi:class I SAM-dependent methyltransferase [Paenibacillus sp. FSL W8-0426]|uniref:class I SAM-dependent methyltransferase n=1 Tax=Paenibacillus sp. FSL W8-0426 TaxID=2921714 RepID=UPI0030DA6B7C